MLAGLAGVGFPAHAGSGSFSVDIRIGTGDPEFISAERVIRRSTAGATDNAIIDVLTVPDRARVHLGGRYLGRSPVRETEVRPGTYSLQVSRDGYYSDRFRLTIGPGEHVRVDLRLVRITGVLNIETDPWDAQIYLDGTRIRDGFHFLGEGLYTLEVRKFGYQTERRGVRVCRNRITDVYVELAKAELSISDLTIQRARLAPESPGILGTTEIRFQASARGTGRLLVVDEEGRTVRTIELPEFRRFDQRARWDGRDDEGERVPDGRYTVVVEPRTLDGERRPIRSDTVVVDASARRFQRTSWSGSAGRVYVPTSDILPARGFAFDLGASGSIAGEDTGPPSGHMGFRFGVGAGFELRLTGTTTFTGDPASTERAGRPAAARRLYAGERLSAAAEAAFTFGSAQGGRHRTGGGASLAVPLGLRLGRIELHAAPEGRYDPWQQLADGAVSGGISAYLGPVELGLSGRSPRLSTEGELTGVPALGLDLQTLIPGTGITLGGTATAAAPLPSPRDVSLGLRLGFLH